MNISNIASAAGANPLSELGRTETPAALEDLLKQAYSEAAGQVEQVKAGIDARFANRADFTKPEQLIALQTELSDFNIRMSLASTLARKGVSAVETLVKAQ